MKLKLITFLSLTIIGFCEKSFAQCTIDTLNFINGKNQQQLINGCVNDAYNLDQTISFPTFDSFWSYEINFDQHFDVDSVAFLDVLDVPVGFNLTIADDAKTVNRNESDKLFTCFSLTGEPSIAQDYTIKLATRKYYIDYDDEVNFFLDTISLKLSINDAENDFEFTVDGYKVNFTPDTKGSNSYHWDFGDGNTSTEQSPLHTYDSVGEYNICLISSNSCGNDTVCKTVNISCTELDVDLTLAPRPDQEIYFSFVTEDLSFFDSYKWDLGDGSSTNSNYGLHSYETAGDYEVCLTATKDGCQQTKCESILIECNKPVSTFYTIVGMEKKAYFQAILPTFSGEREYVWDFGDGEEETRIHKFVRHQFPSAGSYEVCLIVKNICSSDTSCQMIDIVCEAPTADIRDTIENETTIRFNNYERLGEYEGFDYLWEFGDGNTSTDSAIIWHSYDIPGTYNVCLTVSNSCGSDKTCKEVTTMGVMGSDYLGNKRFSVFPNPVKNQITIQFDFVKSGLLEILSLDGQLIQTEWFNETKSLTKQINLASGIYLLRISSDGKQKQQKLIVK